MAAPDSSTSIRVSPLLPSRPLRNSYADLKNLLLKTFGHSKDQQARQFLAITELRDRLLKLRTRYCIYMVVMNLILLFVLL